MTQPESLPSQDPQDPIKQFLGEYFDLTPEEMEHVIVSYEQQGDRVTLSFDFGEGLKNTPDRTTALLKLLRISGREPSL